jgi:hypothetical protein
MKIFIFKQAVFEYGQKLFLWASHLVWGLWQYATKNMTPLPSPPPPPHPNVPKDMIFKVDSRTGEFLS